MPDVTVRDLQSLASLADEHVRHAYPGAWDMASDMPERSTEVQWRLDETGLDVKVSAPYTLKFTAGEVADAVLWLAFARVARILTRWIPLS